MFERCSRALGDEIQLDDLQQFWGVSTFQYLLTQLNYCKSKSAISQPNSTGSYIILCGHWAIYRCLIPVEAQSCCFRSEWIRHLHLLLLVVMVLSAVPCRRVFSESFNQGNHGNPPRKSENSSRIHLPNRSRIQGRLTWKHPSVETHHAEAASVPFRIPVFQAGEQLQLLADLSGQLVGRGENCYRCFSTSWVGCRCGKDWQGGLDLQQIQGLFRSRIATPAILKTQTSRQDRMEMSVFTKAPTLFIYLASHIPESTSPVFLLFQLWLVIFNIISS